MSIFKDIYDVGLDAIETRMPFNIGIGIREEPPMPCVSITNRTRKSPLFIHAVRIHHGRADYSYLKEKLVTSVRNAVWYY
jgi:hypothetical protein